MQRVFLRDRVWRVEAVQGLGDGKKLFSLLAVDGSQRLEVLSPPETCEVLPQPASVFAKSALSLWAPRALAHQAVGLSMTPDCDFAALYAGRILPKPYQFAPTEKLLSSPRNCLLIADDVGLGKTIEAGICMLELIARDTLKGVRDRAILATLLYHGIRREELCGLRVKDLHSRQGVINFHIKGERAKI